MTLSERLREALAFELEVRQAYTNSRLGSIYAAIVECVEAMSGCSDGNCKLRTRPAQGMVTNGGCKCAREIERARTKLEALLSKGEM